MSLAARLLFVCLVRGIAQGGEAEILMVVGEILMVAAEILMVAETLILAVSERTPIVMIPIDSGAERL